MSPGLGVCLCLQVCPIFHHRATFGSVAHSAQKLHCENIHMAREREDMGISRGEGDYVKREKDGEDKAENREENF